MRPKAWRPADDVHSCCLGLQERTAVPSRSSSPRLLCLLRWLWSVCSADRWASWPHRAKGVCGSYANRSMLSQRGRAWCSKRSTRGRLAAMLVSLPVLRHIMSIRYLYFVPRKLLGPSKIRLSETLPRCHAAATPAPYSPSRAQETNRSSPLVGNARVDVGPVTRDDSNETDRMRGICVRPAGMRLLGLRESARVCPARKDVRASSMGTSQLTANSPPRSASGRYLGRHHACSHLLLSACRLRSMNQ